MSWWWWKGVADAADLDEPIECADDRRRPPVARNFWNEFRISRGQGARQERERGGEALCQNPPSPPARASGVSMRGRWLCGKRVGG
jgi:hypothetical protein